jgi:hypothetical protein
MKLGVRFLDQMTEFELDIQSLGSGFFYSFWMRFRQPLPEILSSESSELKASCKFRHHSSSKRHTPETATVTNSCSPARHSSCVWPCVPATAEFYLRQIHFGETESLLLMLFAPPGKLITQQM